MNKKVIAIIFSLGFVLLLPGKGSCWFRKQERMESNPCKHKLKRLKLLDGCTEGMDAGTEFLHSSHNYNERS